MDPTGCSGRNVEIKLRLASREKAARVCAQLGAIYIETVAQVDIYYDTPHGRLKRREETGRPAMLIEYDRPNVGAPAASSYTIHPFAVAPADLLAEAVEPIAVISKQREVWMYDNVRIHLDSVESLGEFLEFEAIVDDNRDEAASRQAVELLMGAFKDAVGEVLGVSNLDLALARTNGRIPQSATA